MPPPQGPGTYPPPPHYGQCAGGTHPTGMHSCFFCIYSPAAWGAKNAKPQVFKSAPSSSKIRRIILLSKTQKSSARDINSPEEQRLSNSLAESS